MSSLLFQTLNFCMELINTSFILEGSSKDQRSRDTDHKAAYYVVQPCDTTGGSQNMWGSELNGGVIAL